MRTTVSENTARRITWLLAAWLPAIVFAAGDQVDLTISSKSLKARLEAAGPQDLPTVAIATLARDYRIDAAAADRQYKGHWFIVTAQVAEVAADDSTHISFWLGSEANKQDSARADLFAEQICAISRQQGIQGCPVKQRIAKVQTGQTVQLECRGDGAPAKTPILADCLLYGGR